MELNLNRNHKWVKGKGYCSRCHATSDPATRSSKCTDPEVVSITFSMKELRFLFPASFLHKIRILWRDNKQVFIGLDDQGEPMMKEDKKDDPE